MIKHKFCVYCGKKFKLNKYNKDRQQYCSRNCYQKVVSRKHNKRCIVCDIIITNRTKSNMCKSCCRYEERNVRWKEKKQYGSLHRWIRRHKPKPKLCEECNKKEPYEVANISGEYKQDINDFRWVCRRCHQESDGRLNNLK